MQKAVIPGLTGNLLRFHLHALTGVMDRHRGMALDGDGEVTGAEHAGEGTLARADGKGTGRVVPFQVDGGVLPLLVAVTIACVLV